MKKNEMRMRKIATSAASAFFTLAFLTASQAASLRSVVIGGQTPDPAPPGGMASFVVSVTRAGGGSLTAYLTITGLPPGATAAFVPPEVAFSGQDPSTKNVTLVVTLALSTPPGPYTIGLNARHGNSPEVVTTVGQLIVGGSLIALQPPLLNVPVLRPDGTIGLTGTGTASQPVLVQATTNLASATSWETIAVPSFDESGFLSLVDQDSTNFPARFYRLAH